MSEELKPLYFLLSHISVVSELLEISELVEATILAPNLKAQIIAGDIGRILFCLMKDYFFFPETPQEEVRGSEWKSVICLSMCIS